MWGKAKKVYNAEVLDDGSGFAVPLQETASATNEDEALLLESADPPPPETGVQEHEDRQPALIERMEALTDALSGLEAKMLCQFQAQEERLTRLFHDLTTEFQRSQPRAEERVRSQVAQPVVHPLAKEPFVHPPDEEPFVHPLAEEPFVHSPAEELIVCPPRLKIRM